MFEFLQNKTEGPTDVKAIRHGLLLFIKDQLKKAEGGEGGAIRGIQLFLAPAPAEKHLYEAAVYFDEDGRFRDDEVQRIADDYAIDLPQLWTMELTFAEALPERALRAKGLPAGLYITTRHQHTVHQKNTAVITVLNGEAEKKEYRISSSGGKVCIGREQKVQTDEGFLRQNTIAFPSANNPENRFISRQHAHIEWNAVDGCFLLFADSGGIPPRNKIKVQTEKGEQIRLQSMEIGYQLKDGDQIVLGESVLLGFRYLTEEELIKE